MNELFKKGLVFVVVFIIICLAISSAFDYVYEEYDSLSKKHKKFDEFTKDNKKIKFLFLGDSRTESDVNPELIYSRAFNYASSAESYIETYYRLKRILEKEKIMSEYIVIQTGITMQVDTGRFERSLYQMRKDFTPDDFLEYDEFTLGKFINYNFGFIGRGKLFGLIFTKGKEVNAQGYFPNTGQLDKSELTDVSEKLELTEFDFYYLEKILQLCKKHNSKIILIQYPELFVKDGELEKFEKHNEELNEFLNDKLTEDEYDFFNYSNLFDAYDYFADTGHLNYKGADALSEKIKNDLEVNIKELI